VLLSGNHELIREWRRQMALERTRSRRPELPGVSTQARSASKEK
ncbi:MAG: tRNA (guanosine(37)-N1)-methyltransferase TrmD, partial [Candidatus Dormibacteraeota bacterium]|nr:tRNA (guanosine(37)-N1)-methyltransferase TrmD [Candidatus Dormibacteraeota bacterium]